MLGIGQRNVAASGATALASLALFIACASIFNAFNPSSTRTHSNCTLVKQPGYTNRGLLRYQPTQRLNIAVPHRRSLTASRQHGRRPLPPLVRSRRRGQTRRIWRLQWKDPALPGKDQQADDVLVHKAIRRSKRIGCELLPTYPHSLIRSSADFISVLRPYTKHHQLRLRP